MKVSKRLRVQEFREKNVALLLSCFSGDYISINTIRKHTLRWIKKHAKDLNGFPKHVYHIGLRVSDSCSTRTLLAFIRRMARMTGNVLVTKKNVKRLKNKVVSSYQYKIISIV